MIIAKGTVIVGDKTFKPGETVSGLSQPDIKRMETEGFIETKNTKPANAKAEEPAKSKEPKEKM